MNTITLSGNVSQAPVLNGGERPYTRFALAVNGWDGEKSIAQGFFDVTVFGPQASYVAQTLKKGSRVIVAGRIDAAPYEKDGETVYPKGRIIATEVAASLLFNSLDLPARQASQAEEGGDDAS